MPNLKKIRIQITHFKRKAKYAAITLRCQLLKRGYTLKLESGVTMSISRLDCKKFEGIRQNCNHQLAQINKKIRNNWMNMQSSDVDTKLRGDLRAILFNKYRNFYVLTFNFPSTSFQVLANGWWLNSIIKSALAMQFEDVFELCKMVFHEEQLISTEKVNLQPILGAIKHNVDPPLASLVYP